MVYQHFAYLYDQFMAHAPYKEWVNFTQDIILNKKRHIDKIVDLGCGTGEISIRLAEEGFEVTGVDQSTEMLTCAMNKALDRKVDVNWIAQDIRQLTGFHQIDLFISYCDVINYITELEEIEAVFQHVYHSLAPEGLFLFDFHSIHYAEHHLMNHTFTDVTEDLAYIWDCEQGDKRGEMFHYLTFFNRQPNTDHYIRFDEIHHQQVYEVTIYEKLLKKCGFSKIEFYHDFLTEKEFSSENSERIFIVAEK